MTPHRECPGWLIAAEVNYDNRPTGATVAMRTDDISVIREGNAGTVMVWTANSRDGFLIAGEVCDVLDIIHPYGADEPKQILHRQCQPGTPANTSARLVDALADELGIPATDRAGLRVSHGPTTITVNHDAIARITKENT